MSTKADNPKKAVQVTQEQGQQAYDILCALVADLELRATIATQLKGKEQPLQCSGGILGRFDALQAQVNK